MSHVNSVTVSGNLTADPELKMVGSDGDFAIVNLRLANNRTKKVGDEYVEEANYFDVTCFGKFGELCDRKLRKADPITVQGRLEYQSWETEDGSKRSKVVIVANEIDAQAFFKKAEDIRPKESNGSAPAAQQQQNTLSTSSQGTADDDIPF